MWPESQEWSRRRQLKELAIRESRVCVCVRARASGQKATGETKDPGPAAGWTVREAGLARRSAKIGQAHMYTVKN